MLVRARTVAISAADPATVLVAVDELAVWFEVDPWPLKSQTLSAAVAAATPQTVVPIGETALTLARDALATHPETARALVDTATTAARKARDPELLKQAKDVAKMLPAAKAKAAKAGR